MLKVIIVDDEIIIRAGFRSVINWEEYGCCVVSTCESAMDAIAFFEKQVPDIVFTDIMMPEMNGIDLVEYICSHYPKTKVVVLSCVNEIEYVKKAIKLGAEDYILKFSITRNSMAELVTRLKTLIEAERIKKGEYPVLKEYPKREEQLLLLLSESTNKSDCEYLLDELGYIYEPGTYYNTGCILIDAASIFTQGEEVFTYTRRYGLLNLIREYFKVLPLCELVFVNEKEMIALFAWKEEESLKKQLPDILNILNKSLKTHLNFTVSMGLGEPFTDPSKIPESYAMAKKMSNLKFFDGSGSFHAGVIPDNSSPLPKRKIQKALQDAIFKQDRMETDRLTDIWFDQLSECRQFERIDEIRRLVVEMCISLSGTAVFDIEETAKYHECISTADFWSADTIGALKQCFQISVRKILDYLQERRAVSNEITKLLHYLETHISEDMSLEKAARYCALGKSQFCILFKKATGNTFVNYFNQLKMKKAYVLLSTQDIQVQQAADLIGIRDISYFSRLFKKHYNVSPSDVKKV